jgi:hypothetical protein
MELEIGRSKNDDPASWLWLVPESIFFRGVVKWMPNNLTGKRDLVDG